MLPHFSYEKQRILSPDTGDPGCRSLRGHALRDARARRLRAAAATPRRLHPSGARGASTDQDQRTSYPVIHTTSGNYKVTG